MWLIHSVKKTTNAVLENVRLAYYTDIKTIQWLIKISCPFSASY